MSHGEAASKSNNKKEKAEVKQLTSGKTSTGMGLLPLEENAVSGKNIVSGAVLEKTNVVDLAEGVTCVVGGVYC